MSNILYVLVVGFLSISVWGADCPYKECFCAGAVILCDDRHLKAIPQKLIKKNLYMSTLNLERNEITTIPARSLPSNLSEISLAGNPIETIDDTAFDESINTLQTVSFSNARFTQIPEAVLHLKFLKSLNIYDINILFWNETAMKQLGSSMEIFNLAAVGLTTWPTWIQSFSHLTELSVSESSISSLPDDALDMVANTLTGLGLYNNNLTSVPKTVSKMIVLRTLSLEQNQITDITWLPQTTKLSTLSLNNNKISDAKKLSNALRFHGDTIYSFDIHDNYLTAVPDLPFLTQIEGLDFTNNHISDPNSGSVPPGLPELKLENNFLPFIPRFMKTIQSVPNLVLAYNRITAIQGTDFPNSTTGVDLGHNLITELTDTSFPEDSIITSLLLNSNPISRISALAFQNLPRLTELNLQYSKLTRVPVAIASLTILEQLDFTGNTDLVCTCMEKSVESRIKSMMPYNVVGNCGQTSLYIFFTHLSQDCPTLKEDLLQVLERK